MAIDWNTIRNRKSTIDWSKFSTPSISPTSPSKEAPLLKKTNPFTLSNLPDNEDDEDSPRFSLKRDLEKTRQDDNLIKISKVINQLPFLKDEPPEVVLGMANGAADFVKESLQGTARAFAMLPAIGTEIAGGKKKEFAFEQGTPQEKIRQMIMGEEPLRTFTGEKEQVAKTTQQLGLSKEQSEFASTPLLGIGLALEYTGFGGSARKAAKEIINSKNIEGAIEIAKKLGLDDDTSKIFARDIVRTKTPKEAEKLLTELEGARKLTTTTPIQPKDLQERTFITRVKEKFPMVSDKVGGYKVIRDTDELAIKARNLILEDPDKAEVIAKAGDSDASVATAMEYLKKLGGDVEMAKNDETRNMLLDKMADIANTTARNLTELGRGIQAATILNRLTPEGQIRFAAREIQKYNEGIKDITKKIPELTGEQANYIRKEMQEISNIDDVTQRGIRYNNLQNYISDLVPTPLMRKLTAIWKAGLLTGLKTSGINILSTGGNFLTENISKIPATAVDKVVSLLTGKRTVTMTPRGVVSGAKEGLERAKLYFKTGYDERNIGTKLDYNRVNMGEGPLANAMQKYTDTVFRILGSEDQPFYYASKFQSLYEQAKVSAINKGLKGAEAQAYIDDLVDNPTEQMIKNAHNDAMGTVFQNETMIGKTASKIQRALGDVGQFLIPFARTPSAVAMAIVGYSPLGAVKPLFDLVKNGKGLDQRAFSKSMGKALTGTAGLALGAEMVKNGLMTLDKPTTERERELWKLEGRTANSIKIGDEWRQVNTLGPIGNVLLIGGHFQNEFSNSGSPTEAMTKALGGTAKSFTEQTFLKGVNTFMDAVTDPDRNAMTFVNGFAGSIVPTIISDVARASDTVERSSLTPGERIVSRIPIWRQELQPQINAMGDMVETAGNPIEIMLDPTRPSEARETPVIQELRRLYDAGYKVSPTILGDKKGYESLSKEENTQLLRKAGQIINSKLSNLIRDERYQQLSDKDKGKLIDTFVDKAKTYARAEVVIEKTRGLFGQELRDKLIELKDSKLMTEDVYNAYLELR